MPSFRSGKILNIVRPIALENISETLTALTDLMQI